MIRFALPALLLTTAACAPGAERPAPVPAPPEIGICGADKVSFAIGKTRDAALGAEVAKRSGAKAIRWITPEMMVTMDYREDRLNVHVGTNGKVGSVRCG